MKSNLVILIFISVSITTCRPIKKVDIECSNNIPVTISSQFSGIKKGNKFWFKNNNSIIDSIFIIEDNSFASNSCGQVITNKFNLGPFEISNSFNGQFEGFKYVSSKWDTSSYFNGTVLVKNKYDSIYFQNGLKYKNVLRSNICSFAIAKDSGIIYFLNYGNELDTFKLFKKNF